MHELLTEGCLVNIEEAANLLRLRPSTIRKWLHEGRLPKIKLGRRTLLRRGDLEEFITKGLVGTRKSESSPG